MPADTSSRTAENSPSPVHWISNQVLIGGLPLKQELYAAVAATARAYQVWRPDERQWRSVEAGAEDQQLRLIEDEHRHVARSRPLELNALHGNIDSHPVHAALIEVSTMGRNSNWTNLLALFAWPHIAPKVLGANLTVPSQHHIKRLGQLLRDCSAGKVSDQILEDVWREWSNLDGSTRESRHVDAALSRAIEAHVHAYRSAELPIASRRDALQLLELSPDLPFEVEIDAVRMLEPESLALAPEDADALVRIVDDRGNHDDDPLQRMFRNIFEGERAFQHLPLAWNRASPADVNALRKAIPALPPDAQLAMALVTCLAITPEMIPQLELHQTLQDALEHAGDGRWHLAVVNDRSIVAVHGVQIAAHSWRRGTQTPGLLPSSHVNVLGLPQVASERILEASGAQRGHLLRFFPEIADTARGAGESLRAKTGARLTFGRIREIVASELFRLNHDECLVARAMPTSHVLVGSGIYYSAYPAIRLYREHARAVESALGWYMPPPSPELERLLEHARVGSELVIDPAALRAALSALYDRTQRAVRMGRVTPERLIAAHNAIMFFTLAVLALTTAHRAINEPFPLLSDFLPDQVLLCDKRQFGSNEQRVVPLAAAARVQLERYLTSLGAIAGYLDKTAPGIAAQLQSLIQPGDQYPSAALFSVLSYSGGTFALRPFRREDWKEFWPEWIWPENGGRHFLMQFLNQSHVERELISYEFGHAELGQTAFNRQSGVCLQQFLDSLSPHVDRLAAWVGINPCDAVKGYRSVDPATKPVYVPVPLYGDRLPDRNRGRALSAREKRLIRQLLGDFPGESVRLSAHVSRYCHGDPIVSARIMQLLKRSAREVTDD